MDPSNPAPVSVIIPTYNRADILRKTLQAYAEQDAREQILEILVVDDGSTDHTGAVIEESTRRSPVPVRHLVQNNAGQASARNHAIREAKGRLMLFGDDDILPKRNLVREHLAWHERYPEPTVGILGLVRWAPEIRATPFMEWSGLYGPQFQYGYFTPGMELDFNYAYFCNISAKSSFLRQHKPFDEGLRSYGWEDIELSYRLYKSGWRVRYNPEAIGYHYKFETFEQSLRRVEKVWITSWPIYRNTESGKKFFDILNTQKAQSTALAKSAFRSRLGRLKRAALPMLRPLMDSRIKFPNRVYDFVWYHYSKPFVDAALNDQDRTDPDHVNVGAA